MLPFSWKCELVRIIIAGALRPARPLVCSAACRNMVGRVGEGAREGQSQVLTFGGTQALCFSSGFSGERGRSWDGLQVRQATRMT